MRRIYLPVPLSLLALTTCGTAVLVAAHGSSIIGWAYGDWTAASAETRQGVTFAGPWAAGCAAWAAATYTSSRSVVCPLLAKRRGFPLALSQLSLLWFSGIAGHVSGMAPLVILTLVRAKAGHANLLVVVGSLCVLMALMAGGYLIGSCLPRVLATPAAAVVSFLFVVMSGANGTPTAPVWPFGVIAGLEENPVVAAFRVGFFGAAAALMAAGAGWWLRERTLAVTVPALAGLLALLAPLPAMALLANRGGPDLVREEAHVQGTCQQAARFEVCVHPARVQMLPALSSGAEALSKALGPAPVPYSRVIDAMLWPAPAPDDIVLQLQDSDREGWLAAAVQDMSSELSGARSCGSAATSTSPGVHSRSPGQVVAEALGIWLARQAGTDEAQVSPAQDSAMLAAHLDEVSTPRVQRAISSSLARIRACQGSPDDVP
jgi:hypothetical protein